MKRARVIGLAIGLAVGMAVGACHSHDDAPAAAVVAGAPAGDVTEVAGDVHATRDGKTRALGKGDVVSGDDVIATGADGRVTIVLRHNQVPWSLGPNKQKKVADSAAWTAAKGASGEAVSDDHSTAAGRHAERSATDTEASAPAAQAAPAAPVPPAAVAEETAPPAAAAPAPVAAAAPAPEAPPPPPPPPPPAHRSRGAAAPSDEPPPAPPAKGAARAESLDDLLGGTAGAAPGGGAPAPTAAPDGRITLGEVSASGGLAAREASDALRARAGVYRACYVRALQQDPSLAGLLTIELRVAADGTVSSAHAGGPDELAAARACIEHQLGRLRFPAKRATSSISAKMTLSPTGG